MAAQIVQLNPGESKLVSFEAVPREARTYQVAVDGLKSGFTAVGVPSITLKGFHYVYQSTSTWLLPPINHAFYMTHVGFTFENQISSPISGISVKMKVEWPDFYQEYFDPFSWPNWQRRFITPAGSVILTNPLDRYLNLISQPFDVPAGDSSIWFSFRALSILPERWGEGLGPSPFIITAWVYINSSLVAERVVETPVSW